MGNNYLPIFQEVLTVSCLVARLSNVCTKAGAIALVVERLSGSSAGVRRRETSALVFLTDSKVVHSVWAVEKSNVARICLNIAPAASLPSAWNEMQLLVGSDLSI